MEYGADGVFWEKLMEMIVSVREAARRARQQARTAQPDDHGAELDQVEQYIFSHLLQLGRLLVQLYANEVGDGDCGARLERAGQVYERKVKRPWTVLTVFGQVVFRRWLYYRRDGARWVPTDAAANLPARKSSYFVQRLLGRLSLRDKYAEATTFFADLFGQQVSTRTAHTIVAETAAEAVAFRAVAPLPAPADCGTLQVVSADGKGVPVIKRSSGPRPARMAKGEKRQQKQEAIVGVVYTINPNAGDAATLARALVLPETLSEDQRQALRQHDHARAPYYVASLTDKESVYAELAARQQRLTPPDATPPQCVCLADGSWRVIKPLQRQFDGVTVILDIVHVSDYVWEIAHAFWGERAPEVKPAVLGWLTTILQGRVTEVIAGFRDRLRQHRPRAGPTKTIKKTIAYFESHCDYMHYDDYLAHGYPIGTGVIESACGHVVKNRMEQAGARWSPPGAEAMLKLRAIFANGHWDDYLEFRKKQERNRLYRQAA